MSGSLDQPTERLALRAALTGAHLLGLAAGQHLRQLRARRDPLMECQARLEQAELRARLAWEALDLLAARFAKLPERRRPYFTPAQRFRILEIKSLLGWSAIEAARVFLVCSHTILNWEGEADPASQTVGSTVKPVPPVRRAADVVRSVVQLMTRMGWGGQDLLSRVLARAGWKVSARSVGRYRKQRTIPPPIPPGGSTPRPTRPVVARFVHHVWMMDVSVVHRFLGRDLFMAAVFDAFSRVPLALEVFERPPATRDMLRLLRCVARVFASPKYLITDLGAEFTARRFRKAARRLRIVQRFGSKENLYATARLERFWLTLKRSAGLYTLGLPLTLGDLEQRLALALTHYVWFRPHEGLRGATPAEALLALPPACERAVEPPRGSPGDPPLESPFNMDYLDRTGQHFPIVTAA